MKLTGYFIEDLQSLEEEYTARMCHYSRRLNFRRDDEGKRLTKKQFMNAHRLYEQYKDCCERLKKILQKL